MREEQHLFFAPPPGAPRGGAHLNCKFIIFGFLDTLKVHIQSNYLKSTTLSLLQTKPPGKKNNKLFFFMFFILQLQILKV